MGDKTNIEWTDATWNPTTGCTKVSAGCATCYAETLAMRLQKMGTPKYRNGFRLTLHERELEKPLSWREPRKVFVNSMSDLFHKDVPFEFIDRVWDVMKKADHHVYQILTKRPDIMRDYVVTRSPTPYGHIWLGTSVEDSRVAHRVDTLRDIPAGVRFVSFEPLIGPVRQLNLDGINWAIVGGESGDGYREVQEEWIIDILRQCRESNVAFFFKQWGGKTPKSGGRLLQGNTYSEYPSHQYQSNAIGTEHVRSTR